MSHRTAPRWAVRLLLLTASQLCWSAGEVAAVSSSADNSDRASRVASEPAPALEAFLDQAGHLIVPAGFSGGLDPSGYEMVSVEGEALRFSSSIAKGGGGSASAWASLGSGVNGQVEAIVISGNHLYAGGWFTSAGGQTANRVARFDMTTQVWSSLGSGTANGVNNVVYALALSGSDLYVGGFFTQAGGAAANRVARFNIVTETWSSLGSGASNGLNERVYAFALSGSELYMGGTFSQAGGSTANRVARFNTTTQTWASLGSGAANGLGGSEVHDFAILGNGLYVGGVFTQAGGSAANNVARFDTVNQTWAPLGTGANGPVLGVAAFGGNVYFGGNFTQAGGTTAFSMARFDTATQSWSSLGTGGANGINGSVYEINASAFGVYVGGNLNLAGGAAANRLARFDTATQSWSSVGSGAANGVNGAEVLNFAITADGALFVGGTFAAAGGQASANIARYNAGLVFRDGFE